MSHKVPKRDRVYFYFAGHGEAENGKERLEGNIIPVDATWNPNSYIRMGDLHNALVYLECRHLLLVLGCCFSGSFEWTTRRRSIDLSLPKYVYKERFDMYARVRAWQVILKRWGS